MTIETIIATIGAIISLIGMILLGIEMFWKEKTIKKVKQLEGKK